MKRIVATSDWHLDAHTAGYARFGDVQRAVDQVVAHVEEEVAEWGADNVLAAFLGDLCDPDANRAPRCIGVAVQVAMRLKALGVRSRWMNGNHDVIEDGSGSSTLSPLAALDPEQDMVRVLSYPTVEVIHGLAFCWLPYVPRCLAYNPTEYVHRAAVAAPEVDFVLGHLTVPGIVPGSETDDLGRGREMVFPLEAVAELWPKAVLLNGHYHRVHSDPARTGPVLIPGSLARLTFGEQDNEPGYLVLTLGEKRPPLREIRFHPVHSRSLVTMPPAEGKRVPDNLAGALVRMLPPAGTSAEDVRAGVQMAQERGAQAIVVHPPPVAPVELPGAQRVPGARARGAREVVLELAGKAPEAQQGSLVQVLEATMDEVGL